MKRTALFMLALLLAGIQVLAFPALAATPEDQQDTGYPWSGSAAGLLGRIMAVRQTLNPAHDDDAKQDLQVSAGLPRIATLVSSAGIELAFSGASAEESRRRAAQIFERAQEQRSRALEMSSRIQDQRWRASAMLSRVQEQSFRASELLSRAQEQRGRAFETLSRLQAQRSRSSDPERFRTILESSGKTVVFARSLALTTAMDRFDGPLNPLGSAASRSMSKLGKAIQIESNAVRKSAAKEGNFVYRGLAKGEDAVAGLFARAPGAGNSPISHVAGKRDSQWISTTKDLNIALEKYGQHGIVRIDLNKVGSKVLDVSGGFSQGGRMSSWARRDQEVLIRNSISRDAIVRVK